MNQVKQWWKKVGIFGRMKPYIHSIKTQQFRQPAPASQPKAKVPTGSDAHKYDISYFKRKTILKGAETEAVDPVPPVNDKFYVAPNHLPRPCWWYEQDKVLAQHRALKRQGCAGTPAHFDTVEVPYSHTDIVRLRDMRAGQFSEPPKQKIDGPAA